MCPDTLSLQGDEFPLLQLLESKTSLKTGPFHPPPRSSNTKTQGRKSDRCLEGKGETAPLRVPWPISDALLPLRSGPACPLVGEESGQLHSCPRFSPSPWGSPPPLLTNENNTKRGVRTHTSGNPHSCPQACLCSLLPAWP